MASKQQQQNPPLSLSIKQKLKLICCNFCDNNEEEEDDYEFDVQKVLEHSISNDSRNPYFSSFIAWIKSELPEFKGIFAGKKYRRNRRVNSSEFRYDPLSYALNFDDDDSHLDEFPLRNFSSRLPPSPVKENQNGVVLSQLNSWS